MLQGTARSGVQVQSYSNSQTDLRSAEDYMNQQGTPREREVPGLGLEVREGTGRLTTGACLRGIRVIRVLPDGPAARAGLKDEQVAGKSVVASVLFAGGLFFPPAIFAAIAFAGSDIGESYDTIIAIDSERVRSVLELEDELSRSSSGPIVYLTVIRQGQRNQIRVYLRNNSHNTE